MTVRRDLTELEREGLLERVHGGAVPPAGGPLQVIDDVEPTFKARIAAKATELLSPYRTIAMDVGMSTLMAAQKITSAPEVLRRKRIFTNSLRIAETLAEISAEVYVPGGRIRADEMSMNGPVAVEYFSQFYFEVSVLGTSGMASEGVLRLLARRDRNEARLYRAFRQAHRPVRLLQVPPHVHCPRRRSSGGLRGRDRCAASRRSRLSSRRRQCRCTDCWLLSRPFESVLPLAYP